MFRILPLEYLPAVCTSLAKREIKLLLWLQAIPTVRSCTCMFVRVAGFQGYRDIGQGAEANYENHEAH